MVDLSEDDVWAIHVELSRLGDEGLAEVDLVF
jgi:hypothetical protein